MLAANALPKVGPNKVMSELVHPVGFPPRPTAPEVEQLDKEEEKMKEKKKKTQPL